MMQGSNEGVYNVFLMPPPKTHFFVVSKLVVFSGVFLPQISSEKFPNFFFKKKNVFVCTRS